MVFRFFCAGRLSAPIITRFTETLPSNPVCAISVFTKCCGSIRLDFGSKISRTGCSPSLSSRTFSIKSSMSFLVLIWSWLNCFLPALGLGLVCSSISARILADDVLGGSSDTMTRHCPRAILSISYRARTRRLPLPVSYICRTSLAGVMMCPPPAKSGAGTYAIKSAVFKFGFFSRAMAAWVISVRLWDGISVAMPTAMPLAPLSSTMGRRAGSSTGSFSAPS